MDHVESKVPRGILFGAFKWLPHFLIIAAVLGYETTLRLQIYENDYISFELEGRTQEVQKQIRVLEPERDRLETMARMEKTAPNLGLSEPNPGQIEVLRAPRGAPEIADAPPMSLARRQP